MAQALLTERDVASSLREARFHRNQGDWLRSAEQAREAAFTLRGCNQPERAARLELWAERLLAEPSGSLSFHPSCRCHQYAHLAIRWGVAAFSLASQVVVARDQRPIGLLGTRPSRLAQRDLTVVVSPERRRQGIGRALVERFLSTVGPGPVITSPASPENTGALAFFRSLGWREEARTHHKLERGLEGLPPILEPAGYRVRDWLESDGEEWKALLKAIFAADEEDLAPERPGMTGQLKVILAVHRATDETVGAGVSDARGNIHWLALKAEHRGHGVGEALLVSLLHELSSGGVKRARLSTLGRFREARRLYQRLGFWETHRSKVEVLFRRPR